MQIYAYGIKNKDQDDDLLCLLFNTRAVDIENFENEF